MAQLVRQLLQLVSFKPAGGKDWLESRHNILDSAVCTALNYIPVVIPENMVVSWSGGSLDSLVRAEIEVELCRMSDPNIHCRPCRNITALAALFFLVRAEQSGEKTLFIRARIHWAGSLTWCGVSSGPQ